MGNVQHTYRASYVDTYVHIYVISAHVTPDHEGIYVHTYVCSCVQRKCCACMHVCKYIYNYDEHNINYA